MPRTVARCVLVSLASLAAGTAGAGVASGRYVGDGTANRAITGAGFRPDVVVVKADSSTWRAVVRTATMGASKEMTGATAATGPYVLSFDADGFTVGSSSRVNQLGVVYYWVAFQTTPGESRTGTYTGDGFDSRPITGLGFTPSYVIVIPESAYPAYHRSSPMQESYSFDSTTGQFDHIQRMIADGFEIGASWDVNRSGYTYHYVAWKVVAGKMAIGSYVGLGNDDRAIAGAGFRPTYVIVKADDNWSAAHKPASTGPATDETLLFNLNANQPDNIQELRADGFEVGRADRVNSSGRNVFWMAWGTSDRRLSVSRGAGTITVDTPEVRMVWDEAKGGGLHRLYAKTEAYPATSRVGSDGAHNLFVTALNGLPEAGAGGALELLEATPTRARIRQKRDFVPAPSGVHMERDWTVYGVPRLGIRETLAFDVSSTVGGATGLHPKGESTCWTGDTFYCAGRSDATNRIWLATDNRTTYSDVLAIPWTSPFFGRTTASPNWESFLEPGTPNTWASRVREYSPIDTSGTDSRSYLVYPHLEGLTSTGAEWQPYAADYRSPSPLAIAQGSPWLDPAENAAPGVGFNEAEDAYVLNIDPVAGLDFSMDGSTTAPRLRPFFKIRQWRSLSDPATVVLQGTTLVNDRDFTADVKPVSYAAFCPDPACTAPTKLARGGLVGDPDEYLADPANNAQLGFSPGVGYLYLGADARFRGLNAALDVGGTGGADLRWEYFDGTAWADLEGVGGFTDLTGSLARGGSIFWGADPPGWSPTAVAGSPRLFYVRATLASGSSYVTPPRELQIKTDILLFQYLGSLTAAGRRFVFAPASSNTRYRSIGIRAHYGTTEPVDGAGTTVTATLGSTVVTGSGTAWLTYNRGRGDRVHIQGVEYTVQAVTAENQLELTEPYAGPSGSGKPYVIARQFARLQDWEDCISFAAPCPFFPVTSVSLVADNRSEVGVAYRDAPFVDTLVIDGSATDANHTITLTADHGNRHYGRAGAAGTAARIDNPTTGPAIRVRDEHVTVEWLEIRMGAGGGAHGVEVDNLTAVNRVLLDALLIHDTPGSGIQIVDPDTVADVYNNVVYEAGVGIRVAAPLSGTGQVRLLNNTVYGCNLGPGANGIVAAGSPNPAVTLRNNISQNNVGGDFYVPGPNPASSHNLASDGSGTAHSSSGGMNFVTPTGDPGTCPSGPCVGYASVVAGAEDLHLVATAYPSRALDTGADLSTIFTGDVDAGVRTGPWDVGADELPVGATDIAVEKDDGLDTAGPGGSITYTLTVRNNGPTAVSSVRLTDLLPPELTAPAFGPPTLGTFDPGSGVWSFSPSLAAGGFARITLLVSLDAAARGTVANTASVVLLQPASLVDPVPQNNSATDTDVLVPSADLELFAHTAVPEPVALGGVLTYAITVRNNGPSAATGVVLTDVLPAEMEFQAVTSPQPCGFNVSTRTLTCDLGDVLPGPAAAVTVTLTVRPRGLGTFTATASVAGSEVDPAGGNNAAAATTTVQIPSLAVRFLTVTSTSGQNVIEWLNPSIAEYSTTEIRYRTDAFPTSVTDGQPVCTQAAPGARDSCAHKSLTDGQTYHYAAFVHLTASPFVSPGRFVRGRPFDSTGKVKWAFSTGGFSVTPPTVGEAAIIATSNDASVHAMTRGPGGGLWPAGWLPFQVLGPVQSRSPVVPLQAAPNPVVFLGSQDRHVYALDAARGGTLPAPRWAYDTGHVVQAAPAGLFKDFGADYDYLLVGTRDPAADNALVFLDPLTGSLLGSFTNGGGTGGIGIINGMAAVDYAKPPHVYFASHASTTGGSARTLWCLELNATLFASCGGWTVIPPIGDIDGSPVIRGDRIYVGGGAGGGTVYSVDAATGAADRSFVHGDGQVKGFVFPDRDSDDIYFATDNYVWSVSDTGAATMTDNLGGGVSLGVGVRPSAALFARRTPYVYVGASDGRLYQVDVTNGSLASLQLGDGSSVVGAPSLDRGFLPNLVHVGTEAGVFYAVEVPLP